MKKIATSICRQELAQRLKQKTAPLVIDVRSTMEYASGHIPNAKHIPFWSMMYRYKELTDRRAEQLILCCEHGPRAWIAAFILRLHGFLHLSCLQDHMQGWKRAGGTMEKERTHHKKGLQS